MFVLCVAMCGDVDVGPFLPGTGRLNSNELTNLPDGIGRCPVLEELHVGFNQLTALSDALGESETLAASLRHLWLFNNRIVQLPHNIVNLKALTDMRLDNNPLRSPPIELLPQVGGRSAAAVG